VPGPAESLGYIKQDVRRTSDSFWGRALGTPGLRDLQHSEFDSLCGRLRAHLAEAGQRGELADGLDLDLTTHQLVVLIDGLSAERVLYPGRVAPERQVGMLDHLLDSFRRAGN
jgi:transcriptional regulator BetI-like protein